MQIFMPLPDYMDSTNTLDKSRLGNQCWRELLTLYNGGWRHHPAARMLDHYNMALYGKACVATMTARDWYTPKTRAKWQYHWLSASRSVNTTAPPSWLGNDAIHSSHRAVLLYKGLCDTTFDELHGRDHWPKRKSDWTSGMYERAWAKYGKPADTWYTQFGWTETPLAPDPKTGRFGYIWP